MDDVKALEQNRLYRFPSIERAVAATLVYGTALGISEREPRELAGLPVPPLTPARASGACEGTCQGLQSCSSRRRWRSSRSGRTRSARHPTRGRSSAASVKLPPPWRVRVDVYNGTGTANAATEIANEIGGPLAYRIGDVDNADRSDYVETRVYFPPGAEAIAAASPMS